MFKNCIIAAAAAATLAACAGQHQIVWDKPNGSIQGFNQDKLECVQTAINTVGGYAAFGNLWMVAIAANNNRRAQQEIFSTCMQARGYTPRDANTPAPPPATP